MLLHLLDFLARNHGSQLFAQLAGWDYPFSLQEHALADLFDLTAAVNSKKSKQAPKWPLRPERHGTEKKKVSDRGNLTGAQIVAVLEAASKGVIEATLY